MKLAVFDLDGTLVSAENSLFYSLNQLIKEENLPKVEFLSFRQYIGLSGFDLLKNIFKDHKEIIAEPSYVEKLFHRLEDIYYEISIKQQGVFCYPHMVEAIKKLHEHGWILAICTGKGRHGTEADLQFNGILEYFSVLKTSSDGYPSKPAAPILSAAIAESGAKEHEAIMIGDTIYDMEMARKINVKSLAVLWGYHHEEQLKQSGANQIISDPSQIFDILEEMAHE